MDQVALIRDKIDIVAFISEYLPVKKAGRNFQALCPFHGEKSPSFMISPERQIWHCFGCGKGGDVFTFLMEHERMEFPEALRFLAKQAGVELVSQGFADSSTSAKKDLLYRINSLTAEYYHYILTEHKAGQVARDYLEKRGINEKLIKTFKLGYSPQTGTALIRYLIYKKKYRKEDVSDAGVGSAKGSTLYDFFRGRLIFPLIDHRDNTLGFSGRIIDEKNSFGGKYINTRDTLVYHKREHFFGLNITKDSIRKEGRVLLVEGEFDLMSCFQHGIGNAVAVKGTALTEQQVNLLSRYAQKVTVCFDGDAAGQEALKRSLPVLSKKNMSVTVAQLVSGKDPDEALRSNPGEFKHAVEHDVNVYDYLFDRVLARFGSDDSDGKQSVAAELLPVFAGIENAIIKEHYLRKLSASINTTYDSVLRELDKLAKSPLEQAVIKAVKAPKPRVEMLEEYLSALVLQTEQAGSLLRLLNDLLLIHLPQERSNQKLLFFAVDFANKHSEFSRNQFEKLLPTELTEAYNTSLLFPLTEFSDTDKQRNEVRKVALDMRSIYAKERLSILSDKIKSAEEKGEEEELSKLRLDYAQCLKAIKAD
jgi:DNA primase